MVPCSLDPQVEASPGARSRPERCVDGEPPGGVRRGSYGMESRQLGAVVDVSELSAEVVVADNGLDDERRASRWVEKERADFETVHPYAAVAGVDQHRVRRDTHDSFLS